jgi:hypothetical protein
MITSKFKTRIALCIAIGLIESILVIASAKAQFVPGGYYYPDMGVMGAVSSAYSSAAQMRAYNENRQQQDRLSVAKSQSWQNINRSMQASAASTASAVDTGQSARDWMYKNAPSSGASGRPMRLPSSDVASVDSSRVQSRPTAPKEIMLWPTLLNSSRFAYERKMVEAPFRRAYTNKTPLTIQDYEDIISTLESMKGEVKEMEPELVETEYASVQKYLDDLIADSQKRIKARE